MRWEPNSIRLEGRGPNDKLADTVILEANSSTFFDLELTSSRAREKWAQANCDPNQCGIPKVEGAAKELLLSRAQSVIDWVGSRADSVLRGSDTEDL